MYHSILLEGEGVHGTAESESLKRLVLFYCTSLMFGLNLINASNELLPFLCDNPFISLLPLPESPEEVQRYLVARSERRVTAHLIITSHAPRVWSRQLREEK